MPNDFTMELNDVQLMAQSIRTELAELLQVSIRHSIQNEFVDGTIMESQERKLPDEKRRIQAALANISPALARGYTQVNVDLQDENRESWAGTAHEIREVLATLLRTLAPDDDLTRLSWYKKEQDANGPTQKQRVRFILQQYGAGSKEIEVAGQISHLEDMIGDLVRATYSRASDAAHRSKEKREVVRIVNYFDVFALDLLNLE